MFLTAAIHPFCRILMIITAENKVDIGSLLLQGERAIKKALCCHGEKLGFVCCAISI
jgi:hypothetical protein